MARLEPELLSEGFPGALVDVERVTRTLGAIQRKHQLAIQTLVQRVSSDQAFELGNKLGVPPVREVCLESILECRQPRLLELERRALGERFVPQIGERLTTPEVERLTQQRGIPGCPAALYEHLEPLEVQLTRVDPQDVARRARDKPIVAERLPQLGDRVLEDLGRRGRGSLAP